MVKKFYLCWVTLVFSAFYSNPHAQGEDTFELFSLWLHQLHKHNVLYAVRSSLPAEAVISNPSVDMRVLLPILFDTFKHVQDGGLLPDLSPFKSVEEQSASIRDISSLVRKVVKGGSLSAEQNPRNLYFNFNPTELFFAPRHGFAHSDIKTLMHHFLSFEKAGFFDNANRTSQTFLSVQNEVLNLDKHFFAELMYARSLSPLYEVVSHKLQGFYNPFAASAYSSELLITEKELTDAPMRMKSRDALFDYLKKTYTEALEVQILIYPFVPSYIQKHIRNNMHDLLSLEASPLLLFGSHILDQGKEGSWATPHQKSITPFWRDFSNEVDELNTKHLTDALALFKQTFQGYTMDFKSSRLMLDFKTKPKKVRKKGKRKKKTRVQPFRYNVKEGQTILNLLQLLDSHMKITPILRNKIAEAQTSCN